MQFYPSPVEEDVIRTLLEAEEQLIIDEDFIIEEDEEQGNHILSRCNLPPFIQPLLHACFIREMWFVDCSCILLLYNPCTLKEQNGKLHKHCTILNHSEAWQIYTTLK